MFTLRPSHMEAFAAASDADFEQRLAGFVQTNIPGLAEENPADLRAVVHCQAEKARAYGLVTEQEIAVYVSVAALIGETFDTDSPAATQLLTSPVLPGVAKADWLAQWSEAMLRELQGGGK
jgi:hypothetical protein